MRRWVIALAIAICGSLASGSDAGAVTIPVTNLQNSGNGSLRSAVGIANLTPQRDLIAFDDDLEGGLLLFSALPPLAEPVDIEGPGADRVTVIAPDISTGVFSYNSNLSTNRLALSGLTLAGSNGITVRSNTRVDATRMSFVDGRGAVTSLGGDVRLIASTASGNTISSPIRAQGGEFLISASTISGNEVSSAGTSAGIRVSDSADVIVRSSTIAGNSAPSGSGANILVELGEVSMRSTIVADASGGGASCVQTAGGFVSSVGHNLEETDTCSFERPSDKPNTNPLLGALGDYGGPTETLPISRLSPAIDAGSVAPEDIPLETFDQRGFDRFADQLGIPADSGSDDADIGAYEHRAILVTDTDDSGEGSLRAAVGIAASEPGYDIVSFAPSVDGTIPLESQLPNLTPMDIRGPGANVLTVRPAYSTTILRVFNQSSQYQLFDGLSRISGLTIARGKGSGSGQGVFVGANARVALERVRVTGNTTTSGVAGGIHVDGELLLQSSTVDSNSTEAGVSAGGIYVANGGVLEVDNSTVRRNESFTSGTGNIRAAAGSDVTITNSTIAAGRSDGGAGNLTGTTATVKAGNSIFADPQTGANCSAAIASLGHNLDSGATCGLNGTGDLANADAGLGVFLPIVGETPTYPLLDSSDAIDAGVALASADVDQRGLPRPVDFAGVPSTLTSDDSDIGAYERQNGDGDGDGVPDGIDRCPLDVGVDPSGCPLVERKLTLKLKKPRTFKGKLTGASCTTAQGVKVLRVKGKKRKRVAKGKTKASGKYALKARKPVGPGRYVATVKRIVLDDEAECPAVESKKLRVK